MSAKRVASRYAKALVDFAVEQKKLEEIHGDMDTFMGVHQHRDFALLVKSPIVKADKKEAIFEAIFGGKLDPITMQFFKIILKKGRESYLPHIAAAVQEQYKLLKEISTVRLTSAAPLSEAATQAIKDKLQTTGQFLKHIELEAKVDPRVLGGFRLEYADKLYDATVAYKLDQFRKELENTSFQKTF